MEQQTQTAPLSDEYIRCYICGHIDNLEFCSSCGHQLKKPAEKVGVFPFMMEVARDILTPLMTGLTTFFLFILQPKSTYEAIFIGTKTDSKVKAIEKIELPLLTFIWGKVLHKKQKIFEPSGYLVFITIVFLYINHIYSDYFIVQQSGIFEDVSPFINDILQQVQQETRIIYLFTIILITCIFFAFLIKTSTKQLTWINAYAISIYLNGTNILNFCFGLILLRLVWRIFPDNYFTLFFSIFIFLMTFFVSLIVYSIISPIVSLPTIFNTPRLRFGIVLVLSYILFPVILYSSTLLTAIIYMNVITPVLLVSLVANVNTFTKVCCGSSFVFLLILIPLLIARRRPSSMKQ